MSMSMPDYMSMSMPDYMSMSMPAMPVPVPKPNGLGGSTDTNTDTDVDTAAPTSLSPSLSPSWSAPSSAPSSTSDLELEGNSDAVIMSGLGGDSSVSTPSRTVTPGQTAIISLAVCTALALGLLVLRRQTLVARCGSISSGLDTRSASQGSVSSLSDFPSQVGDSSA
jgi:hypothetical protein